MYLISFKIGAEPVLGLQVRGGAHTLPETHSHTPSGDNVESPINLPVQCVHLDCRRKPEILEETHTNTRKANKL